MEKSTYHNAFSFLKETIRARISETRNEEYSSEISLRLDSESFLAKLIDTHQATADEVIILLLALVPHVLPGFLDELLSDSFEAGIEIPDFGGVRGTQFRGIQPTAATACYIISGADISKRMHVMRLFENSHWFHKYSILRLEAPLPGEPKMSGRLLLDEEYVERLTTGRIPRPDVGYDFAAEFIETPLDWKDLVLNPGTEKQIEEVKNWLKYEHSLFKDWGLAKIVKPGYRVLMHGTPGTGKTLTSMLLGKATGRDVFRVDLSQLVSKYIGETSKNLAKLFDKAKNKNWILLFDEGEVMFSKRMGVKESNDMHANQNIAYLLQRIESFDGLVIVATNLKSNMDEAFLRRFQSIIYFPKPNAEERLKIWNKALPSKIKKDKALDMKQIAERYELTGSNIVNIIQKVSLQLISKKSTTLTEQILIENINKEFLKEGKMI